MDWDWNNLVKKAVNSISKKIPYVGIYVSELIGLFWPDNKKSVWDKVKDQVQRLVDQKIVGSFFDQRKQELKTIKQASSYYDKIKDHPGIERATQLTTLIGELSSLKQKLWNLDKRKFYLQVIALTAVFHLCVLKERAQNGKVIYNEPNVYKIWQEELQKVYDSYYQLIKVSFLQWKNWYSNQIQIKCNRQYQWSSIFIIAPTYRAYGKIDNRMTGESVYFQQSMNAKQDYFEAYCQYVKQRMVNQAVNQMISHLICFYETARIVPKNNGNYLIPQQINQFKLGPYSPKLISNSYYSKDMVLRSSDDCTVDKASKIHIRYYNSLDGIGFVNEDTKAQKFSGNPNGGKSEYYDIHEKHNQTYSYINGIEVHQSHNVYSDLTILYADGIKSNKLGNLSNWNTDATIKIQSKTYGYAVCGAYLASDRGTTASMSIDFIKMKFKFRPELL